MPPQNTQAVTRTALDSAKKFLQDEDFKNRLRTTLPKHVTPDRLCSVTLTAMLKNPKLLECFQTNAGRASIAQAILTGAQLGLEPDGEMGAIVPFNDKRLGMIAQWMTMYKGMVQLAYNHPSVKKIWWSDVRENDSFEYGLGLTPTLIHRKGPAFKRGALTHAYACCQLEGGDVNFIVVDAEDIETAKSKSRGSDSEFSPWKTSEPAMWAKTAVRRLAGSIPRSNELRAAIEAEDEHGNTIVELTKPVAEIGGAGAFGQIQEGAAEAEREHGLQKESVGDRLRNAKPVVEQKAEDGLGAGPKTDAERAAEAKQSTRGLETDPGAAAAPSVGTPPGAAAADPSPAQEPAEGNRFEVMKQLEDKAQASGVTAAEVLVWAKKNGHAPEAAEHVNGLATDKLKLIVMTFKAIAKAILAARPKQP